LAEQPVAEIVAPTGPAIAALAAPDFRAVFDASPQPLLLMAADAPKYTMLAVNVAHARAFATTPEALVGWGVLEVFGEDPEPSVAPFVEAIRLSLEAVVATRAPHQMAVRPYPVTTPSGEADERYWSAVNSPILGPDGAVIQIVSAVQDVTGEVLERRSEEARNLLMREVDHRARNALTVVQSFVRLTTAETLQGFRKVLDGRVEALARAQTSLAARRWEGASLRDVIEGELAPLAEAGHYVLEGPQVLLPPEHVQAMSMAIHELATNAAKYGALSTRDGRLTVRWRHEDGKVVTVCWAEPGGPPVEPPKREGFGSRLVGQLARQIGGEVRYDWRTDGLSVELDCQLD
jgi:two-component sensor histidine kinase